MNIEDIKNTIRYNQLLRYREKVAATEHEIPDENLHNFWSDLDSIQAEIERIYEKLPRLPHGDALVTEYGSDVSGWPASDHRVIEHVLAKGARDGFYSETVRNLFDCDDNPFAGPQD